MMDMQSAHKALILASVDPATDWHSSVHQRRLLTSHSIGLCEAVASLWCHSFGAGRKLPIRRLADLTAAGFANFPTNNFDRVDIMDGLHHLARSAIEGWFEASGLDASGRNFDGLRYRYLILCRHGAWADRFMDPDAVGERLRTALTDVRFAATPARRVHAMTRQSL